MLGLWVLFYPPAALRPAAPRLQSLRDGVVILFFAVALASIVLTGRTESRLTIVSDGNIVPPPGAHSVTVRTEQRGTVTEYTISGFTWQQALSEFVGALGVFGLLRGVFSRINCRFLCTLRFCACCGAALAVLAGLLASGGLAHAGLFRSIGRALPRFSGLTPAFAALPWACTHAEVSAFHLLGQRALVTGANSGLGLEAAKVLARSGAAVALACRSPSRCAAAAEAVRAAAAPGAPVTTWQLDTASLASVRAFAAAFLAAEGGALDMLLLNAGIASAGVWTPGAATLPLSIDGIEAVLATNHVGHALLYELLLPALRSARTARVVLTSSASSFDTYTYGVATDLATLNSPPERGFAAVLNPYGQSKLAQIIWAQEATERLAADGIENVFLNAMHPGSVDTNIWPSNPILSDSMKQGVVGWLQKHVMWSAVDGALTLEWLAMAEEELRARDLRGLYWHPQCVQVKPHPAAANKTLQRLFWKFTEELTRLG